MQHILHSQPAKLAVASEMARETGIHFGEAAALSGVAPGTITVVVSDLFHKRLEVLGGFGLRLVFQGTAPGSPPTDPMLPTKAARYLENFLTQARVSFISNIFAATFNQLANQNAKPHATLYGTVIMKLVMVPTSDSSSSSSSSATLLPGFKFLVPAYVKPDVTATKTWPVNVPEMLYGGQTRSNTPSPEGTDAYAHFREIVGAAGFKTSDEGTVPPRGSIIYGGHGTTPDGRQIPFFTTTDWRQVKVRLVAAGKVMTARNDAPSHWKYCVERISTSEKGWSTYKKWNKELEYETGCLAFYTYNVEPS